MKSITLAVLGVALLSTQAFGQLGTFFPRLGVVDLYGVTDSNWAIVVADSNQGMLVSPLSASQWDAGIFDTSPSGDPILRPLTEAPHQLDNGDYAVAVGLVKFNPAISPSSFQLKGFLQLRLAGSSATALTNVAATPLDFSDPTNRYNQLDNDINSFFGGLAAMATASGLWTSPTAYIEFNPANAFVSPLTFMPPSGPQDWGQFVFPEPGTAILLACALMAPALTARHR